MKMSDHKDFNSRFDDGMSKHSAHDGHAEASHRADQNHGLAKEDDANRRHAQKQKLAKGQIAKDAAGHRALKHGQKTARAKKRQYTSAGHLF